jgi:hypothetical protein
MTYNPCPYGMCLQGGRRLGSKLVDKEGGKYSDEIKQGDMLECRVVGRVTLRK